VRRELSRHESGAALAGVIADATHELNNMLVLIRGRSARIAAGAHGVELAADLDAIDEAVARAGILTRQLRALGRIAGADPARGAYTEDFGSTS
jgi:signal transduction histidine kinase